MSSKVHRVVWHLVIDQNFAKSAEEFHVANTKELKNSTTHFSTKKKTATHFIDFED